MKLGLPTRGKWTSEHDVSQGKSEVFKNLHHYQCFVRILEFYYFLSVTLKLYMLRMIQNYIFEKVFVIRYMISIDNIEIK